MEEIFNDIRDLILDLNRVTKRIDSIWRYTNRGTGDLNKNKWADVELDHCYVNKEAK